MIDQATTEGKILTTALDLAASPGWLDISLRDIADAAGLPLADVLEAFSTKEVIIQAFVALVDKEMLTGAGDIEREQSTRDAVFEVIMSRFDVMAPYRTSLKSISDAMAMQFPPDLTLLGMTLSTQNKILQAAGVSHPRGSMMLRQLGLVRIYGQVFRIWLDDEDPGMARTMAALDKRLRQGERTLRTLDDIARSSERVCAQTTDAMSKVFERLRRAATSTTTDTDGANTTPENNAGQTPDGNATPSPSA